MGYAARPRRYLLTPSRKGIGKAVARGSRVSLALQCLEDERVRKHIIKRVGKIVMSEVAKMCSNEVNSILKQQSKTKLFSFNWDTVIDELRVHAPTLLEILQSCTNTKVARSNRHCVIAMCASMLCKLRCPTMSLAHKTLSLILYSGHCSKKVGRSDLLHDELIVTSCPYVMLEHMI